MRKKNFVFKDAEVHMSSEYRRKKNRDPRKKENRQYSLVFKSMLLTTALLGAVFATGIDTAFSDGNHPKTSKEHSFSLEDRDSHQGETAMINNLKMANKLITSGLMQNQLGMDLMNNLVSGLASIDAKLSLDNEFVKYSQLSPQLDKTERILDVDITPKRFPELEPIRLKGKESLEKVKARFDEQGYMYGDFSNREEFDEKEDSDELSSTDESEKKEPEFTEKQVKDTKTTKEEKSDSVEPSKASSNTSGGDLSGNEETNSTSSEKGSPSEKSEPDPKPKKPKKAEAEPEKVTKTAPDPKPQKEEEPERSNDGKVDSGVSQEELDAAVEEAKASRQQGIDQEADRFDMGPENEDGKPEE
ncbi:hypothetical protein [Salipaludibacillus sp. CF4.18]|uniref:hypothetical protein n=1 Tax=Salipaludibacillus sp. CF4.18 TaxID=3373081 RepID=UPI003EE59D0D